LSLRPQSRQGVDARQVQHRHEIWLPMTLHRLNRLRMAPDTWQRHQIVSELVGSPGTLLDVGGVAGELSAFLPGTKVVTANVDGPADLHFDGAALPFPDRSFEAATSLDVLEHIPRESRQQHLRELVRVSRRTVVICCPLGTPAHVEAERGLSEWHRSVTGSGHRFLDEHLERGLPTEKELRILAEESELPWELRFQGDFRDANDLFALSVLARMWPRPLTILRYARARLFAGRSTELVSCSQPETNRAYLIGQPFDQSSRSTS